MYFALTREFKDTHRGGEVGGGGGNFSNRAAIMAGLSQVITERQIIIACYILRHLKISSQIAQVINRQQQLCKEVP